MKNIIISTALLLSLLSLNAFSAEVKNLNCNCIELNTVPADPNYGQWPGDDDNSEGTFKTGVLARCYIGNDFDSALTDQRVEIEKAIFTNASTSQVSKKVEKACTVAKKQAQIVLSRK